MTLSPIGDRASMDFMTCFYDNWLSSPDSLTSAEALHRTRLYFINHPTNKAYQDPKVWSPYVLVGGCENEFCMNRYPFSYEGKIRLDHPLNNILVSEMSNDKVNNDGIIFYRCCFWKSQDRKM